MKKEDVLEMKIELSESEREQLDLAERLIVITIITPKNMSWGAPARSLLKNECIVFNEKETHLYGVEITDFGRTVEFAIHNSKFETVDEDCSIPRYDLETAREKFPFLFKE